VLLLFFFFCPCILRLRDESCLLYCFSVGGCYILFQNSPPVLFFGMPEQPSLLPIKKRSLQESLIQLHRAFANRRSIPDLLLSICHIWFSLLSNKLHQFFIYLVFLLNVQTMTPSIPLFITFARSNGHILSCVP
jgi:hypothetical protein